MSASSKLELTRRAGDADSHWKSLYKLSGAAALIVEVIFLLGLIGVIIGGVQPDAANGWLSPVENNWLVVLFKLNAGISGGEFDHLYGLNPLDIAILVLVAATYLGLYGALRRTSRIWSAVAALQPFLGIALFVATKLAGRSTVMSAGLVISLVMLRGNIFNKTTAFTGILACVLLLVGDVGTSDGSTSILLAVLIGIGYVLLTTWFFLVGGKLFQLGRSVAAEQPS